VKELNKKNSETFPQLGQAEIKMMTSNPYQNSKLGLS
jgi:hypothetical protein